MQSTNVMKRVNYILGLLMSLLLLTSLGASTVTPKFTQGMDSTIPWWIVFKNTETGELTAKRITGSLDVDTSTPVNPPPIADAGEDTTLAQGQESVILDGSASHAQGSASIVSYSWAQISGGSSNIVSASHDTTTVNTFVGTGNFVYQLTITDDNGLIGTDNITVTIPELPDSIYYVNDSTAFNLTPVSQSITGFTDVVGDPHSSVITATASNGWGITTVNTAYWKPDTSGTSATLGGATDPLINDFGGFYNNSSNLMKSGFVADSMQFNGNNWNLELTGLDADERYIIQLTGSKNGSTEDSYRQNYYIQNAGGSKDNIFKELNAFYNTSWYVQVDTVQPGSDGTIKMFVGCPDSTGANGYWYQGIISAVKVWQVSKTNTSGYKIALKFFRDKGTITLNDGAVERKALVYLPQHGYNPDTTYPVLFYLCGNESSGSDIGIVRQYGIARMEELNHDLYGIDGSGDTVRFVVIAPQFNVGEFSFTADQLHAMYNDFRSNHTDLPVDISKIYAAGFSSGGGGVVRWMYLYPGDIKSGVAISPVTSGLTDAQIGSLAHVFSDNGVHLGVLTHSDQSLSLSEELKDSISTYSPNNVMVDQWFGRGHDGFNKQFDTSYTIPLIGQTMYSFLVNPTKNIKASARFSFTGNIAGGSWTDPFTTTVYGDPSDSVVSVSDSESGITVTSVLGTWTGTGNGGSDGTDSYGGAFGFYTDKSTWTSSGSYASNGSNLTISGLVPNAQYELQILTDQGSNSCVFGIDGTNKVTLSGNVGLRNYGTITAQADSDGEIDCYAYGTINGVIVRKKYSGDNPPFVFAGTDQTITLPTSSVSLGGTVTDDGDIASTTWSVTSKPSGASPSFVDASSLTTTLSGLSVAGSYTVNLTATDDASQSKADSLVITVNEEPSGDTVSVAKFMFGPTGASSASGYAQVLGSPYDAQRTATQNGITVTTQGAGNGTYWGNGLGFTSFGGGATTGNNSGIRPDNVLQNFMFSYENGVSTPTTVNVEVSGLDANAIYQLKVGGSRASSSAPDTQLGNMAYTVGGTEYTLDVTDNTSKEVTIIATSSGTGTIDIKVHKMASPTDTQQTGYIGWLEVLKPE